jgi:putative endonuclease
MSSDARTDGRAARGRAGEDAALAVYEDLGFHLVARNWRCRLGELDLVVHRRGLLVFCEVKARGGASFGGGYEAVTGVKQRKVRQLAETFLLAERPPHERVRFDVASVALASGSPSVELFEDAF